MSEITKYPMMCSKADLKNLITILEYQRELLPIMEERGLTEDGKKLAIKVLDRLMTAAAETLADNL
jgi:hypothetical protein